MSEIELTCCPFCGHESQKRDLNLIKKSVCRKYGIRLSEIESPSRKRRIVKARHEAMRLCRQQTDATQEEIGKCFNRKHPAVLHAINSGRQRGKDGV